MTDANVKTTHHRARKAMMAYDGARVIPTAQVQDASRNALFEFMRRLEAHDVAGVAALLAQDVKTTTDGGGEFRAALRTIVGRDNVSRFYVAIARLGQGITVRPLMRRAAGGARRGGIRAGACRAPIRHPGGARSRRPHFGYLRGVRYAEAHRAA